MPDAGKLPTNSSAFPVRYPGSRDVLQPPQDVDGFFRVALARPVARKFLFFQAEPTKKLPELPDSEALVYGQLGVWQSFVSWEEQNCRVMVVGPT